MANKPKLKNYTVKFRYEQINATMINVKALNMEDAKVKARRKWRNEEAMPSVSYVEES